MSRSVTLRDCWNEQWANHNDETSKLAAANGMTDQEFMRHQAQQQELSDYEKKVAAENAYVMGVARGEGIMDGFAATMSKLASRTGAQVSQNSANTLVGIFCPNQR